VFRAVIGSDAFAAPHLYNVQVLSWTGSRFVPDHTFQTRSKYSSWKEAAAECHLSCRGIADLVLPE
jgi:hypothetical protein